MPKRCAGVDGCPGGWVVASREGVRIESSIAAVLADFDVGGFDVIGIDMPIGLPVDGPRSSDIEARRSLRPRGSTVFPAPPRACIAANNYSEACALARQATGKAISIQAWNLVPKIRELDALVSPDHEHRVAEIHPECSFLAMNDDRPLASKHTAIGRDQRTALVLRNFGTQLANTRQAVPRGARFDDVLDAHAVLWSTERFSRGVHRTFPSGAPQRDARGLTMRIVV